MISWRKLCLSIYSLNNIAIYDDQSKGLIKDSLTLYENENFKGDPVIIIDKEKITDLRNKTKAVFFFRDYFKHIQRTPRGETRDIKDLPFDFIAASGSGYYLAVNSYHDNVASIHNKGKSLFLKLSENDFLGGKWPEASSWSKDTNKKIVQTFLRKLEKEDKSFFDLIESFRKCVNEKDLNCFEGKLNASDKEYLNEIISEWNISKNEELCKYIEHNSITNEVILSIKRKKIPWEIFKKMLDFLSADVAYELIQKNFSKESIVKINYQDDCKCNVCILMMISFRRKIDNSWEFTVFKGYGDQQSSMNVN